MRQMVACFAVFYTIKWCKPFYASLSSTLLTLINPQTIPSIPKSNYSPPSSGRGWGWGFVFLSPFHEGAVGEAERHWCLGFVCLTLFYALLSTSSSLLSNPQTTSSICKANYSPLSSERGWGRGSISPIPSPQQKGKVGHENARPFVISMKEWFILVATSQR